MADKKTKNKQENVFTKKQILASEKYVNRKDILGALLKDDDVYTIQQINSLIEKFMKGKVN